MPVERPALASRAEAVKRAAMLGVSLLLVVLSAAPRPTSSPTLVAARHHHVRGGSSNTVPKPTPPAPKGNDTSWWSAGMEHGNLGGWFIDDGGGIENSGVHVSAASRSVAHTGRWSLKATINTTSGPSGVRAFRWNEPRAHRVAYYSVWMYIPRAYLLSGPNGWWNVVQFKSRTPDGSRVDPLWGFYAQQTGGGLVLRAGWGWGGTTIAGPYASSDVSGKWYPPRVTRYLPVGRWIHLEAYLAESKDFDGKLKFWQDGTLLFDLSGIRTSYPNCDFNSWCADDEWGINLYSDGISPSPAVVYFDDASISRTRR